MDDARTSGTWKRSPRLLLIDSDAETRGLLAFALRADGYDLRMERRSGNGLLDEMELAAERPDVVVVLLREPEHKLERLCISCARQRLIPLIVVTAFGPPDADAWAARVGATRRLGKLDVELLRATVKQLAAASPTIVPEPMLEP